MSTNSGGNVSSKASSDELIASGTTLVDSVWLIILQFFGLPGVNEGFFLHITLGYFVG